MDGGPRTERGHGGGDEDCGESMVRDMIRRWQREGRVAGSEVQRDWRLSHRRRHLQLPDHGGSRGSACPHPGTVGKEREEVEMEGPVHF